MPCPPCGVTRLWNGHARPTALHAQVHGKLQHAPHTGGTAGATVLLGASLCFEPRRGVSPCTPLSRRVWPSHHAMGPRLQLACELPRADPATARALTGSSKVAAALAGFALLAAASRRRFSPPPPGAPGGPVYATVVPWRHASASDGGAPRPPSLAGRSSRLLGRV